ncbi:MAG TPA: aminopeptidase, partial [Ktedonobacterales bacterium]|nr:aminopeptidase [Ktedonobacterales bacterium]
MPSDSAQATFETNLERYATVLLQLGVNLQPDQNLILDMSAAPVEELAPTMRLLTRKAYELGARNVFPRWDDAEMARTRMLLAPEEALSDVQLWRIRWYEEESARGTAFLSLTGSDPDLFDGVATERLTTVRRANARASERLMAATMKLAHPWSVGAVATRAWARKVFPDLSADDALAALWAYIFKATRADQPDPLAAWREHLSRLNVHMDALNRLRFKRLHYRAPGTELTIDLPEGHLWEGGGAALAKERPIVPNIPTEEVFSLPQRDGVNGVVSATMPLNYNGVLIEGIRLTLAGGRITRYSATSGEDALASIIETDDGSHYLGEVALVPHDSPVNRGSPVYNTL